MSSDIATNHGTLSSSELRQILALLAVFRTKWETNHPPRIEDCLEENPDLDRRTILRELLAVEFEILQGMSQSIRLEDYRTRFPEDGDLIEGISKDAGLGQTIERLIVDPSIVPPIPDDLPTTVFAIARSYPGEAVRVETLPDWIGRYQVEAIIGEGGYGRVYRALDGDLGRRVAIKVPHPRRVARLADAEAYLAEAQIVANLDYPGIVPVYDLGRTSDGLCFIVSKFVEGGDLSRKIRLDRPTDRESSALLAEIADAADHAHHHGLVHRDIKPRNILLDLRGRPYLTDFGAALREQDFGKGSGFIGTPFYMSPEQARGEGHRVDHRSDVFSLGVVLYELLTGGRPFRGSTWRETIDLIKEVDPRSPRDLNPQLPEELERICLKALSKRASERYRSAAELAEDLRQFLGGPTGPARPEEESQNLVPRGLRSFEAEDAESFLRLLPGPRNRDGLALSLQFWLDRIVEPERQDEPIRVGLVFGPSGSGKSSMIKAGLLPRLPRRVISLHLEASSEGTEDRLATALRRRWPELPVEITLAQMIARIRSGEGPKEGQRLLIVLDQFEQFLQGRDQYQLTELADALRQVDGSRVICLVIVRDDFWMSVTRFFQALEIPIVDGRNGSAVDLFDLKHARKVLEDFGRAYRALPVRSEPLSGDQLAFLDGSIDGLTGAGKVIPVHLSLFAEMVKEKPWTPATLRSMGGAKGVGLAFLEETFGETTGSVARRSQSQAARAVLEALLPEPGAQLKGATRLRSELLEASGHSRNPGLFEELERMLDQELRLITPVETLGVHGEPSEASYQLTHDYLVPSLREWLFQKLRETRRGRVRLRLAERASLWNARPERKQLPSVGEWVGIKLMTSRAQWDRRELAMMHAANLVHSLRIFLGLFIVILSLLVADFTYRHLRSRSLVEQLRIVEPAQLSGIVEQMEPFRSWVEPRLRTIMAEAPRGSREALRARLALLHRDSALALPMVGQLLDADAEQIRVMIAEPGLAAQPAREFCWKIVQDPDEIPGRRLRAASILAHHESSDDRWRLVASDLVDAVTAEDFFSVVHWSAMLRPIQAYLRGPLRSTFLLRKDDPRGDLAAAMFAEYTADEPWVIASLILEADARQLRNLLAKLNSGSMKSIDLIADALERLIQSEATEVANSKVKLSETDLDRIATRRAIGGLALLAFKRPTTTWSMMRCSTDNRVRTYLILWSYRSGIAPGDLIRQLSIEPDPSVRQAIVLALGSYGEDSFSIARRKKLVPELVEIFRSDPNSGVHLAVEWLIHRWKSDDVLRPVLIDLMSREIRPGSNSWYYNSQGDTMVVIPRSSPFLMGSPLTEQYREVAREVPHRRAIDRSFAIGSKEVTVQQYLSLFKDHKYLNTFAPSVDCPVNRISWYDGARYFRLLSEREGFTEDQMCYPSVDQIKPGMIMIPNYLDKPGYRYPTEAEWEYSARAGTSTPRFYGHDGSREILDPHAWVFFNSDGVTHPVGLTIPNPFGLFDLLGNAYERCHDAYNNYPVSESGEIRDQPIPNELILKDVSRVIRGGAFHRFMDGIRSAGRHSTLAHEANDRVGFRVVRTVPDVQSQP